jgi:hypothetical protein
VKLAEATLREQRDEKAAFMEAEGRSLAEVMGAYFDGADSEVRALYAECLLTLSRRPLSAGWRG